MHTPGDGTPMSADGEGAEVGVCLCEGVNAANPASCRRQQEREKEDGNRRVETGRGRRTGTLQKLATGHSFISGQAED